MSLTLPKSQAIYNSLFLLYQLYQLHLIIIISITVQRNTIYLGPKEQQAFETLSDMLCLEPILISPDMNKPFYISVDACDFAVEAILEQKINNKMHPVAYASRTLKGAELRYSIYDKEL